MIDPFSMFRLVWLLLGAMLVAVFSIITRAHAYIPKTRTILEKTVHTHGTGFYTVQQEVVFSDGTQTTVIQESWLVENGASMLLEGQAPGARFMILYKDQQKFFVDSDGSDRALRLPSDNFEHLFHIRSVGALAKTLQQMQILSSGFQETERPPRSLKEITHAPEPFSRLSRTGGVITFALGSPAPVGQTSSPPGLWIEQDKFVIRKLRLPSQAEIVAENYGEYSRGFMFPKNRRVTWDGNSVGLRVIRINGVNPSNEIASKLSSSLSKNAHGQKLNFGDNPLAESLREFYLRFR